MPGNYGVLVKQISLTPGQTKRVTIKATGSLGIVKYKVTCATTKGGDKKSTLRVTRGTANGETGTSLTSSIAPIGNSSFSGATAIGDDADLLTVTGTIDGAQINNYSGHGENLGATLSAAEKIQFALTSHASTTTNPVVYDLVVVMEV